MKNKSYLLKYAIDYLSKFDSSKNNLVRILKMKIQRATKDKKEKFDSNYFPEWNPHNDEMANELISEESDKMRRTMKREYAAKRKEVQKYSQIIIRVSTTKVSFLISRVLFISTIVKSAS